MTTEKILDIEVITPQKKVYTGKARAISLPGSLSPFQVLPSHAPIVSGLEPGIIKIEEESGKLQFLAVADGFVEVKSNLVSVLVEKAIESSQIDANSTYTLLTKAKNNASLAKTEEEKNAALLEVKFAESCLKLLN